MAEKSKDAFRTISEVAEWLDVPTHVLRFWESRFSQIKPVKRAGGRRYYRPSDMRVIGGVKVLLHDQGMTIRGVQKLFREEGIKHVSGFAPSLFDEENETPAETEALNETALEQAARPAAAARSTHAAELNPVDTAAPAADPGETTDEPAVPMFQRARTVQPEPAPVAEPSGAPLTIPTTPNVPATDAEDDAPEHETGIGLSARLKLLPAETALAHRTILSNAADQLRTILNRAS